MNYCVGFKVDARCYIHVDADSPDEAIAIAENEICDYDVTDLEWIETAAVYAEDDEGNLYEV